MRDRKMIANKIKSISHITFVCKNLEKTSHFLKELFDAKEIYSSNDKTFSISKEKFFMVGDLWIAIMEGKSINQTYNHIAFSVNEKLLPMFEAKIKDLGLKILPGRPRKHDEGKSIYFYDYDNHLFELHTGDLKTRLNFYNDKIQEQNALNWALQYLKLEESATEFESKKITDTSYSSVYKIQTLKNSYYLKQTPQALFTEPQILNFLTQHGCKNIPVIVATNDNLCCFLMMASGDISLRTYFNGNLGLGMLKQGIANYTSIQHSMEKYTTDLMGLGVPDWRLDRFPTLYYQLIQQKQLLLDDGLSKTEIVQLQQLHPTCLRLRDELAQYKIPETIGHCDFHDNNMLLDQKTSSINIIDWGETVITHPFLSLQGCLWHITYFYKVKPTDSIYHALQTQCVTPWLHLYAETKLLQALNIAAKLNGIYAALGFARLYAATENQLRLEHNGAIAGCLRSFLKAVES